MVAFRFLHAADIHLDSPMRGLEADPDIPAQKLREASRYAFRNLIDNAIELKVAFVLIAGDLYDGDWPDWRTGLFLIGEVARLTAAKIPVVMIAGNHDAASVITRHLRLPEHVTLLPHNRCGQVIFEELRVAIHGQSFASKAVTDDLTLGYPDAVPGLFNIGVLHTALNGRTGHDNYAPTTVDALIAKGYDYWALGHVHAREEVHREPWIVFPGNLQGRQIREVGAKGATLVSVADGRVIDIEHRPLDVLRWCCLQISLATETKFDGAMARVGNVLSDALHAADGRPIAARVVLTGSTALHGTLLGDPERLRQGIIAEGRQHGSDVVWIESVVTATTPAIDSATLSDRPDVIGRLIKILDELIASPGDLMDEYPERIRDRLRGVDIPLDHPLATGTVPTSVLEAARDLVLSHLASEH